MVGFLEEVFREIGEGDEARFTTPALGGFSEILGFICDKTTEAHETLVEAQKGCRHE
jgi:hypothetical protein